MTPTASPFEVKLPIIPEVLLPPPANYYNSIFKHRFADTLIMLYINVHFKIKMGPYYRYCPINFLKNINNILWISFKINYY